MEKHYKLKNILSKIIKKLKKQDYLVYFRKISLLNITENTLTFGVVSSFMKDNLEAKFSDIILECVREECGEKITKVEFVVDNDIDNPSNSDAVDCQIFYKEDKKSSKAEQKQKLSNITPVEKG